MEVPNQCADTTTFFLIYFLLCVFILHLGLHNVYTAFFFLSLPCVNENRELCYLSHKTVKEKILSEFISGRLSDACSLGTSQRANKTEGLATMMAAD